MCQRETQETVCRFTRLYLQIFIGIRVSQSLKRHGGCGFFLNEEMDSGDESCLTCVLFVCLLERTTDILKKTFIMINCIGRSRLCEYYFGAGV